MFSNVVKLVATHLVTYSPRLNYCSGKSVFQCLLFAGLSMLKEGEITR